ncbi:N/A [soil metagenome]
MRFLAAMLAALAATAVPADAQALIDQCVAQTCKARLTAPQLLVEAQALVSEGRYDEARPMLAALSTLPDYRFETRFLSAYVAAHTGDYHAAERGYRAILVDDPGQTRVRLELGRALLALGDSGGADAQFRLAQQATDLPPEIAKTIRGIRDVIRSKRAWKLNFDFGFAPDTNINNATSAQNITVVYDDQPITLAINPSSRARSGIGETGSIDAGLRLPVKGDMSMLLDFDASGTNYPGSDFDDFSVQAAAGPEFKLSRATHFNIEGLAARRWFGGQVLTRQVGAKAGVETNVGSAQRLGFQIDTRHTSADFDHGYDGWQVGAYASYERVVARAMIASASLFARRDALDQRAYSNVELGANLGIGGELPFGFNMGVVGGASRALYDAPLPVFSPDPRKDWRFTAQATLGTRAIRVIGFSPQVSWSYAKTESSLPFYATQRSRVRFSLARYF